MKDAFFKVGVKLTEDQVDELVSMLTKRCSYKVKSRIRSLVTFDLDTLIEKHWGLKRFYINDEDIRYNAGQCYPSELTQIRDDLIKMFP